MQHESNYNYCKVHINRVDFGQEFESVGWLWLRRPWIRIRIDFSLHYYIFNFFRQSFIKSVRTVEKVSTFFAIKFVFASRRAASLLPDHDLPKPQQQLSTLVHQQAYEFPQWTEVSFQR